jgi:hypothetical protein
MGRKPGSGRVCLQMSCRSISLLRVPATYLTWANLMRSSFLPLSRISKLPEISGAQNSDSLRLQRL